MRLKPYLATALLATTGVVVVAVTPWLAVAQTSDPDDDDDDSGGSSDDDADVPDPDDASSDPDPADDPTEDPVNDPVDTPGSSGDDASDGGDGDAPAGDDDSGSGAGDGGAGGGDDGGSGGGSDDDNAPAGGDNAPAGGDDDAPAGGANNSDDDDGPPSNGGSAGNRADNDDDDDDGPAANSANQAAGSRDDDDDDNASNIAGAGGNDDDDDDTSADGRFLGDEQVIGGGDETEAQRLVLDDRDGIDTDREGFRYRTHEFVALDLDAGEVARLSASGFQLLRSDRLTQVGGTVHLIRGPRQLSDEAAVSRIEEVSDPGSLSFNHLFDSSSGRVRRLRAPAPMARVACGCQIGLIDTGVGSLPSFRHVAIEQRAFNATAVAPQLHGTAVAHLFAGTQARLRRPTRVLVADIFGGPRATAGSTYALVRALDWLASRNIAVINVSLAGPRNAVVAATVARLAGRGHVIVAAAGNDGPAAPPVFPGAYQNVVAVTAVDSTRRIYRYANRGAYVDFAATGVDVPAINVRGQTTAATGTSFAAPVVAARLASRLTVINADAARRAIAAIEAEAQDLGQPGRDPVYGSGLVPVEP